MPNAINAIRMKHVLFSSFPYCYCYTVWSAIAEAITLLSSIKLNQSINQSINTQFSANKSPSVNRTLLNKHFVVSFCASIVLLLCYISKTSFCCCSMVLSLVLS